MNFLFLLSQSFCVSIPRGIRQPVYLLPVIWIAELLSLAFLLSPPLLVCLLLFYFMCVVFFFSFFFLTAIIIIIRDWEFSSFFFNVFSLRRFSCPVFLISFLLVPVW